MSVSLVWVASVSFFVCVGLSWPDGTNHCRENIHRYKHDPALRAQKWWRPLYLALGFTCIMFLVSLLTPSSWCTCVFAGLLNLLPRHRLVDD